jgi:RNA polymerase sigma-70 factor (ECF subfamily)
MQEQSRPNKATKLPAYNDEQLIVLSRREEQLRASAFAVLVARYENKIYLFCLRYLRHEEDAKEACQEAFLRAYRYLWQFEGRASFKTWLYQIASNQCATLVGKRKREPNHLDIADFVETLPIQQARDDVESQHIATLLATLTAKDQIVIQRRFFEDQSLEQLAKQLNISLSAAKMRLYRALERFKNVYLAEVQQMNSTGKG